ncbi:precorrin-2 C(20)-methyltransferase [Nigerium massiliense]|uniref:precorrin-2 C(20)-methyltransferase n=1 Tax=Nigerium massiliense TaxID=1522317 RepID=UPI00059014FC|nr:precorrin-2 C(20)-methyltransferase [Nigerium massiliense]
MDGAAPTPVRRLLGVGVGPGEAELITVKAVRALESSDVILVPSTEKSGDESGRAETIVTQSCRGVAGKIRRVPFTMADRSGVTERRAKAWETSAAAAVEEFRSGATTVSFATVGDPSVYSTFSYLAATVLERLPDVAVEVVPGITAMQALAAASRTPLVEGTEVLALVPVTAGMDTLDRISEAADTVCAYKAGRRLPEVLQHVGGPERTTIVGTNIGLAEESITPAEQRDAAASYFSTVLSTPRRSTTGGRL